jgi:hypothetical protein
MVDTEDLAAPGITDHVWKVEEILTAMDPAQPVRV